MKLKAEPKLKATSKKKEFVTFSPNLRADDLCANFWMRQVIVRLRREVSWCWRERGVQPVEQTSATLPPFADQPSTVLDMKRFWEEKQKFYRTDPTAHYLTKQLDAKLPRRKARQTNERGSFAWVVDELNLGDAATFTLALALTSAFDASAGSVVAACLNDPSKTQPNLALAQKLWDAPDDILALADSSHALYRTGLVAGSGGQPAHHQYAGTVWDAPLVVPTLVARQLLFPKASLPQGLSALAAPGKDKDAPDALNDAARLVAVRLKSAEVADELRVVPVVGPKGAARRETVRAVAQLAGRTAVEFKRDAKLLENESYLNSLATICWLRNDCLFLNRESASGADQHHAERLALPASSIPAVVFISASERSQWAHIPSHTLLPSVPVAPLTYEERVAYWKHALGAKAKNLDDVIAESSRRFRYEPETIDAICVGLRGLPRKINEHDFVAACRAELEHDIGELASRVTPRFQQEKLILPYKQHLQFEEQITAMNSLTEVHYGWGTAKVWNEGGISVLFAGPPGTGKTMAAEIIAIKLGLPMYRIDLSQVVNKYIGETQKNLKRLFDAADVSDVILFFDEADSLFGRRTEVSDAHDRYANLEISYLLERMERFKGLAILATNRKKDLDEAFLRRLRYIIEFPLPDVDERRRIWQQMIPPHADASALDMEFLARQFQLSGGHIRSVVFNACLQCAGDESASATHAEGVQRGGSLTMREVIIAVKREFDKMNRTLSLEQYGVYAEIVEELENKKATLPVHDVDKLKDVA